MDRQTGQNYLLKCSIYQIIFIRFIFNIIWLQNTTIGTVISNETRATDADQQNGGNDRVLYSILSGTAGGPFRVCNIPSTSNGGPYALKESGSSVHQHFGFDTITWSVFNVHLSHFINRCRMIRGRYLCILGSKVQGHNWTLPTLVLTQ